MPQRLTDKLIWEYPAPAIGNKIYYDAANAKGKDWTPGFGLRVTAAGARSFVLTYRTRSGLERRLTIGALPVWNLSAAREEGRRLRLRVDNGEDPLADLKTTREAPTVGELCDRFVAEHFPKKRPNTRVAYGNVIAKYIRPELGSRKVAEITFTDVDRLHQKITKGGKPYVANRAAATLSKMFNLAVRWGMRRDNPVRGVERNHEDRRARYLTPEELARLSRALAEHPDQVAANIIRLLLLTGARKTEVLAARWEDIDLKEGVWAKPGATTKQKTLHRIPLSAAALKLLTGVKRDSDKAKQWVFPGRVSGQHRINIKDDWAALCEAARISGARIHDLRHTYASLLASAKQSLPIIGALLGHSSPTTTNRYAHLLDDPLREATESVGAMFPGGRT